MKLTDFDKNNFAPKALQETYKMSFDVSRMSQMETKTMLKKVRTLAMEAKQSDSFYKNQTNPAYMKLVFMEEALVNHFNQLASQPKTRIVFENEEVEKSQVILAAQDLCDSIQKMLEDVGQMQVKELPALSDSIESEIGVNEAQAYNEQVSTQLDALSAALKEAFTQLKSARDSITPQGAGSFTEPAADMGADLGADLGAEAGADMGADLGAEEEPEPQATGSVGRAKR